MKMFKKKSFYSPYEDQEKSIKNILDRTAKGHKRTLFIGATGSGKTVIFSEINRRLFADARIVGLSRRLPRILFIVHRDELVRNTVKTLIKAGFDRSHIGVVAGLYAENRTANIQIVTVQTASGSRDLSWFDWDIAIFDEVHTTGFSSWGKNIHLENKDKTIIGLTATPWREKKQESLSQLYPVNCRVLAPLPSELMKMGRLVKHCRYFKSVEINTEGMNDITDKELSRISQDEKVVIAGLQFWDKHAKGESVGVFCVDVNHANFVAEIARKWGRKVAVVTAETPICTEEQEKNPPKGTRQWIYRELALNRAVDMLISIDCISEGFDVPALRCGWGLRRTNSASKFYQQLGRILRAHEGKEYAIFLDQAQNLLYEDKHGKLHGRFVPVEDLEEDDFKDILDFKKGKRPPPRLCLDRDPWSWKILNNGKGCLNIVPAKCSICPHCGFELPVRKKREAKSEIVEVNGQSTRVDKKKLPIGEVERQRFFLSKMNDCFFQKYDPGFLWYEYYDAFGKYIPNDYYHRWVSWWRKKAVAENNPTLEITYKDIREWLSTVAKRKGKEQSWIDKYEKKFTVPGETFEIKARTSQEKWEEIKVENPFIAEHFSFVSFKISTHPIKGEEAVLSLAGDNTVMNNPLFVTNAEYLGKLFAAWSRIPTTVKLFAKNRLPKQQYPRIPVPLGRKENLNSNNLVAR